MILRVVIFFSFIITSTSIFSQSEIDSLKSLLSESKNDSLRFVFLIKISEQYHIQKDHINFKKYLTVADSIAVKKDIYTRIDYYNSFIQFYTKLELFDSLSVMYSKTAELYAVKFDSINYLKKKNTEAYYLTVLGNYNKANQILYKNLRFAERKNDSSLLSEVYMHLGYGIRYTDNEKAKEYFERSLEYNTDSLHKFYSVCLNEIGNMYTYAGKPEIAVNYLKRALELRKLTNDLNLSYSYNDIAYTFSKMERYYDAILYMTKCIEFKKDKGAKWDLAYSYASLGYYYMKAGKLSNAEKNLNIGLEFAEELNLKPIYVEVYNYLYELYKVKKDYKTALEYFESAKAYEDSVSQMNVKEQITELEKKYQNEKQNAEINLMQIDEEANKSIIFRQRIIGAGTGIVLIIVLIFAFYIYKSRQKEKKANEKLQMQNEEIQQQKERIEENAENLKIANKKIADKNIHITDNIKYARKIQNAMLPSEDEIKLCIPDHFILYKPKNIVSGDFYFVKQIGEIILFAVADCTGHGVSGAFMSILGMNLLNEITFKNKVVRPDIILNILRDNVKASLRQEDNYSESSDGIDIAFASYNKSNGKLMFSGAEISLYILRADEIMELNADMMPVGIGFGKEIDFKLHEFILEENDTIYLFTDGYPDQFGGEHNRKMMLGGVMNLLKDIADKPLSEQKNFIEAKLKNWQGNKKQIDDILFAGFKFYHTN